MPKAKTKYYARIAITLPEKDLAAADRLAKQLDRSRSWVIAEAVRRFAEHRESAAPVRKAALRVAEPASAYAVASDDARLDSSRMAQLVSDMKLTPEQRVREAEETLRLDEVIARRDRRPRTERIQTFRRIEDYWDWSRLGGRDR